MLEEKRIEFEQIVSNMMEVYYEIGKLVFANVEMEEDAIIKIMDLDVLTFLYYLCGDREPNEDEICYIQHHTRIELPYEYWKMYLSDLNIDLTVPPIPKMFDIFTTFDNRNYQDGNDCRTGEKIITILQTVGLGFEAADKIINQTDLDRLDRYLDYLKEDYDKNRICKDPINVEPIDPELVNVISYSTVEKVTDSDENTRTEVGGYQVNFLGKVYPVPEGAVTFFSTREFVGKEISKLIKLSSQMVIRYSETDPTQFFDRFSDEIDRYQTVMMEICQDVVDDLSSRNIYDVSVTDLSARLSGFEAVKNLGYEAVQKATRETQKLVDAKRAGIDSAYQAAASTVTGSGLRIITTSLTSLLMYSAMEKQILRSKAKKADRQYEKAVQKIQAACDNAFNRICTSVLINDFGLGLVEIIETLNDELMQNYLLELTVHNQFDVGDIEPYSENRSNAILENLPKVSDKRGLIVEAYEACPFNIEVYEKMLEAGFFDVQTLKDAKKVFPVEILQGMLENQISDSIEPIGNMDEYIAVLTDYLNMDEEYVINKYFSKYGEKLLTPYLDIKAVSGNLQKCDQWIREHVSEDMDQISELSEAGIQSLIQNYMTYNVNETEIVKMCQEDVNLLEKIQLDDKKPATYEGIKQDYVQLLTDIITKYVYEARTRRKAYENAYAEYNKKKNEQNEKITVLQEKLRNTGLFSFSKKKEVKQEIRELQAALDDIKEPVELKNAYYNMYRKDN